jgi:hypothetical protein
MRTPTLTDSVSESKLASHADSFDWTIGRRVNDAKRD